MHIRAGLFVLLCFFDYFDCLSFERLFLCIGLFWFLVFQCLTIFVGTSLVDWIDPVLIK